MSIRRAFPAISLCAAALGSGSAWCAELGFKPAALDFGSPALKESKRLQARLFNSGAADISLAAPAIEGPDAADFSVSAGSCGDTLAAGASCVYSITYRVPALTPQSARLVVRAEGLPAATLPLSGNLYPATNDTGLTGCSVAEGDVLQPCPSAEYPGQDADYGRDRTRNQDANGQAGFSFTKLDGDGRELGATAKSWKCVRDNVTGLVWEVKPVADTLQGNQGLHDPDDTHTWYSTDAGNNGGVPGEANPAGNTCTGYAAADSLSWCNTENYVYRVNRAARCGFQDWRLPSRPELAGLQHLGNLRIDLDYFPDTNRFEYWNTWTSSPYAPGTDQAWFIDFTFAVSHPGLRSESHHVRLVRGGR